MKIPPATQRAQMRRQSWDAFKADAEGGGKPVLADVMLPELHELRTLASLMEVDAKLALEANQFDRAARQWLRLLAMGRALDSSGQTLIELLVAHGIYAKACLGIREAAQVWPDEVAALSPEIRAALHAQLRISDRAERWRQAVHGEAMAMTDVIDASLDGRTAPTNWLPGSLRAAWAQPIIRSDQAKLLRWFIEHAEAAEAPSLPAYTQRTPSDQALDLPGLSGDLADLLAPSMYGAARSRYRISLDLAASDVALAVAEYRADHDMNLPPSLDALVPEYLPSVPADPLAAQGELRYDATRGLLWSVGDNGTDDGGSTLYGNLRRVGVDLDWDRLDRLYPLTLDAQNAVDEAGIAYGE